MGSRLRSGNHQLFEVVVEIKRTPNDFSNGAINFCLPANYSDDDLLKSIPEFAFPFSTDFASPAVDHFTFVLTDIDSKFRFGFCRLSAQSELCLCVVSYYPWFEIFYRLLNHVAEIQGCDTDNDFQSLLRSLLDLDVSSVSPGKQLHAANRKKTKVFAFNVPDCNSLPSIPDNRNLTEYYSTVDSYNMMIIFASMLFERRILVVSRKLSRLTSCVHGAASLFYPFHWQHLYIPVLPPHLVEYCCAPMPYLIGIHSTLMSRAVKAELGDVVVLDADANSVSSTYDDLSSMPTKVVSFLKKELRAHKKNKATTPCVLMGQTVSRAFLRTLVRVIGGYRNALVEDNGNLIFDKEMFIETRSLSMHPFLDHILNLQAFEQFINDRILILKKDPSFVDDFETEIAAFKTEKQTKGKYKVMWPKYDKALTDIANKVKSTGISTIKTVKTTINDFREMDFGTGLRRHTDVGPKIIVSDVNNKALMAADSTFYEDVPRSSPKLLRGAKPRGNLDYRHRSFRISTDDSEVLDILLQASLPLLTDGDMDKVFRKYSCDNLDGTVSASDDSDISRDTTSSSGKDGFTLRYENLKLFGNKDRAPSEINSRMVSSTPNIVENLNENTISPISLSRSQRIESQTSKPAFQVTFDSNQLSKRNGENSSDIVRRFDRLIGKPAEQSDFHQKRAKRLSVRYLPNVKQIIQRYENSSTESYTKPVLHSSASDSSESMVATHAARYMSLERNVQLGIHSEPRTAPNSRTLDTQRTGKISGRNEPFHLISCSSNDSSSSINSNY